MNDVDRALSQISNIRSQLAAQTRFLGLSPSFNVLMGCVALLITGLQGFYWSGPDNRSFIAVWSAVLVATFCIATLDLISRTRRCHGRMATPILVTLLQRIAPFKLAAVMLTWVLCSFAPDAIWLLPGLWQMLLGLLGFAALASLPRGIIWVACWYFACSVLVLVVAAQTQVLSPWMMGVPLGIGQIIVGIVLSQDA